MPRARVGTVVVLALAATATGLSEDPAVPGRNTWLPGWVMVKFASGALHEAGTTIDRSDLASRDVADLLSSAGFTQGRKIFRHAVPGDTVAVSRTGDAVRLHDLSRWYVLTLAPGIDVPALAQRLDSLPSVESAVPGHAIEMMQAAVTPDDPTYPYQWGLAAIHAPDAWQVNKGRDDVVVAIVDGGVDDDHTDLDPGDRSRVILGYDVADEDADADATLPAASQWNPSHGTMCASIAGARTNNGAGMAGVMWNCRILPVKIVRDSPPWYDIFDWSEGQYFVWDAAEGIDYARAHGADVINLSIGSENRSFLEGVGDFFANTSHPLTEAVENAYSQGIVLAAAMGNDAETDNDTMYPAGMPWVLAVGALTSINTRAPFSRWGPHIDLAAPGVNITAAYRLEDGAGYPPTTGTSVATPLVSGVAGLLVSQIRDRGLPLRNDDVMELMKISADDITIYNTGGGPFDEQTGWGLVDAGRALRLLSNDYAVVTAAVTGGTDVVTWPSHDHTFRNFTDPATGEFFATNVYYGVDQHRVTNHVDFGRTSFLEPPVVWVRPRSTCGWSASHPNMTQPWARLSNVTPAGFDTETFVYWVTADVWGHGIFRYFPSAPQGARVEYALAARKDFVDATAGSGIAPAGNVGGATWQDLDGDGDLDLLLVGSTTTLYRNDGGATFSDVTPANMRIWPSTGRAVACADYNNDGRIDVFVVDGTTSRLFRNFGGFNFLLVSNGTPVADPAVEANSAAWADYDRDGLVDLYIGNVTGPNRLCRNAGPGAVEPLWNWTPITTGPLGESGPTEGAAWADWDDDASHDPDLFLANSGYFGGTANKLLRNDGGGAFTVVNNTSVDGPMATPRAYGLAWGDYDNDQLLDLYLACSDGNKLFDNGAGFASVSSAACVTGDCRGAIWFDLDNDCDLDLYVMKTGAANELFVNNGDGGFGTVTEWGDAGVLGNGCAAAGDYDEDGDLDLLVGLSGGGCRLLRNNWSDGGNHDLHVRLRSLPSNRCAIGARVRAVIDGVSYVRECEGGGGDSSHGSLDLEFGLGLATAVDLLEVRWPSGATNQLLDVACDQHLVVEEASTTAAGDRPAGGAPLDFVARAYYDSGAGRPVFALSLPAPASVAIDVYAVNGQRVWRLEESLGPGPHRLLWPGSDAGGRRMASGVYGYRVVVNGRTYRGTVMQVR